MKWKYFTDQEVEGLQDEFIQRLDKAREIANTPFVFTSTVRTITQNEHLTGAVKDSAHLTGLAADIRAHEPRNRFKIAKALIEVGFTRIGIYNQHIHVDMDTTKDPEVLWIGVSH